MKTNMDIWSYPAQFFLEWEMFEIKFVKEIKEHILYSITYFNGNSAVYEKYFSAWQATDDNRAHALCLLGT